ncbi:hypothetical protein Peur_058766 [Populus x canadensis]
MNNQFPFLLIDFTIHNLSCAMIFLLCSTCFQDPFNIPSRYLLSLIDLRLQILLFHGQFSFFFYIVLL